MRLITRVGLVLCLCVAAVYAKPGVVRTKDGRAMEGDVTESEKQVSIVARGVTLTLRREDVTSITYATSLGEQYEQRQAAMPKNAGAKGHMELAKWLFENKAYELSRKELDKALEIDPNNAEAVLMKQTVDRTIMWERTKATNPPATRPATPRGWKDERRTLTADEINTIRQFELRDGERPRVRLDGDVRKKFVEHANINPKAFADLSDPAKAAQILARGTPQMRKQVRILTDPVALLEFKQKIQPMLLTGCATAACHGGPNAGKFVLFNPVENEAATYTNFYFLTQYSTTVNGVVRKAIDRQQPRNSLLVQFAIPRERAESDHPEVAGFVAVFKNDQDIKFRQLMTWLGVSLAPIQPDYGIDYPVPQAVVEQSVTEGPFRPVQPQTQPAGPAEEQRKEGEADETMKTIRERMRPIRGL